MSEEKKYYVYVHRYASGPKNGEVFYVGKGTRRRYKTKSYRNKWWHSIVEKYGFVPEIVMRFHNQSCAFSFEISLIKYYGRENLCNLSDGGEGVHGFSEEMIEKFRKMHTGRVKSKEEIAKIVAANTGRVTSQETKDKLSSIIKGRKVGPMPQETKDKISKSKRKMNSRPIETSCGLWFNSIASAVEYLSVNGVPNAKRSNISCCLNGRTTTAYGYQWSFSDRPTP